MRKRQKYENFDKNHDFSKNFDFCDFWFSCICRDPYLCLINDPLLMGAKKFRKIGLFGHFFEKVENWPPPPNLLKSQWRSASIKKVTKGLLIFSPIHGRMQKIRKSYWIVFENMHGGPGPVIYGTTTRTGQGPYPALPDNECTYSDHLGGRRGPTAGVGPESGAFSSICLVFWVLWFFLHIW